MKRSNSPAAGGEGGIRLVENLTPDQEAELALEDDCIRSGINTYRRRIQSLQGSSAPASADPLAHLVSIGIEPLAKGIIDWILAARSKAARRATALPYIEAAPAEVSALITIRAALNAVYKTNTAQTVALRVAKHVQDEMMLEAFEHQQPFLYEKIQRYVENHPHGHMLNYRRNVLRHSVKKYGIAFEEWPRPAQMQVGLTLLELMAKTTGLIELKSMPGKHNRRDAQCLVVPTDALMAWVDDKHAKCEVLGPPRLPMVCPPTPFTDNANGGYLRPALRRPLVKAPLERGLLVSTLPIVAEAVNTIMDVPMEVNPHTYAVVSQLWSSCGEIPKAAKRFDTPKPPPPATEDKESFEWRRWKAEARDIYLANLANSGQRVQTMQTLVIAGRMVGRPIWFPHFLDFRGRVYSAPQFLSPQGTDLAKGLLRFHRGKPLGSRGVYWLTIHLANCYGVDKVSINDRLQWVKDNESMILRQAEDPYDNREWHDADSPCQFLAACYEWAGYRKHGESFVSHLPITVDGSCNGIQHLAALSKDEQAGREVNLVPGPMPSDIYSKVAGEVVAELEGIVSGSIKVTPPKTGRPLDYPAVAQQWLDYGVDRKLTKRPTMILPYGGTINAVQRYIEDEVADRIRDGKPHPFGKERGKACRFLSQVMWAAMGRVVNGPRKIMAWTREVAKVCKDQKVPISWTSPSGFRVQQCYKERHGRVVQTNVGDRSFRLTLLQDTSKIDYRRQAQSLAPNWIHSLDAAALHRTIVNLKRKGVVDVLVVHDSYGTHACDMDTMAEALREEFVSIYSQDVVGQFLSDVGAGLKDPSQLPPPPAMGALRIEEVARSTYFFA